MVYDFLMIMDFIVINFYGLLYVKLNGNNVINYYVEYE